MIRLGIFDQVVSQKALDTYTKLVQKTTRVKTNEVTDGSDKLIFFKHIPEGNQMMNVSEVQTVLNQLGFFPGGQVDGMPG